ncbi:MAG: SOS response-associated peptidase [Deltaproteobacteria bacterium]|nr:SOS response-associated peptidase [Deltaproteobacteria bacterium]
MCGRFVLTTPAQALAAHFDAWAGELVLAARYNIAPTQNVVAVRVEQGRRRLVMLRWGLVPAWAKDPAIGNRMINARAETAAEKPSFRAAFASRRCIVPASGFYEWKREGARKQPWYFHARDNAPLAIAALWERWRAPDGAALESCALLTTTANALASPIHDRMPVLLSPRDYARWLDPTLADTRAIDTMLVPAAEESLAAYPVATAVGDAGHDDPRNIEPVGAA